MSTIHSPDQGVRIRGYEPRFRGTRRKRRAMRVGGSQETAFMYATREPRQGQHKHTTLRQMGVTDGFADGTLGVLKFSIRMPWVAPRQLK